MLFFADHRGINRSVAGDSECGDLAFRALVQHKSIGAPFGIDTAVFFVRLPRVRGAVACGNSQDAAARLRARQQCAFAVERQHANVRFIAGIKKRALSIWRNRKNLPLVAGGNV